jgi:uncharacterized protein with GYD domain
MIYRSDARRREMPMPRYLIVGSYSREGLEGMLKEGGSGRRDAIAKVLSEIGGTLEAFYFAFGAEDVYVLADIPDNVTAAAIGLTVGASGAVSTKTVVLLTPEEIDEATKKTVPYRPPGQ